MLAGWKLPSLSQSAIFWYFFAEGFLMGNWAGLIPTVQSDLGLNDGLLGDVLFAAAAGALFSMPVVPYCNRVFGSAITSLLGGLCLSLVFVIIGISTYVGNIGVLTFGTFLLGFSIILMDASINSQASFFTLRDAYPIFGRCHGLYSIGALVGSLIGASISSDGLSAVWEFTIISCVIFGGLLFSFPLLINHTEENILSSKQERAITVHPDSLEHVSTAVQSPLNHDNDKAVTPPTVENHSNDNSPRDQTKSQQPSDRVILSLGMSLYELWLLLLLTGISFIAYFGEGAVGDWSAIYVRSGWDAPLSISTLGFALFQLATALCRLYSDRVLETVNKRTCIVVCGFVTGVGFALSCIAYFLQDANYDLSLTVLYIGYLIAGIGCGPISAVIISIASSSSDNPRLINLSPTKMISLITTGAFLGTVLGPPLMGNVSDGTGGLQWSFLVVAALFATLSVLALALESTVDVKKDKAKESPTLPTTLMNVTPWQENADSVEMTSFSRKPIESGTDEECKSGDMSV